MKMYIHERTEQNGCQFGWAENDTMAPHQVRHECDWEQGHTVPSHHECTCGLIEET